MTEPLFSIITVTWNAADVIGATIKSVTAQTCRDFEWIVVDGASTDDTVARVRAAGIGTLKMVSEPDNGLYDAMNKGLSLAGGRYVLFLNAGDAFASADTLARYATAATNDPDVIYGQTQLVDREGNVTGMRHLTAPEHLDVDSFSRGMMVCHQAFAARRTLSPPYDMHYRYSADYDWCIAILKKAHRCAYLGSEPVISYLDEGLTTRNHRASLFERFDVMRRHYGLFHTLCLHLKLIVKALFNKLS